MPYYTDIYKLPSFTAGEVYSASLDRRRFSIIDNQLAFLSDYIGQGVINGFLIEEYDGTILVSPGMGLVGREAIESFRSFSFDFMGEHLYVYLKKRDRVISGSGSPSSVVSIFASDISSPVSPSNVQSPAVDANGNVLDSLNTYEQISISWDENTEVDFDKYLIYIFDGINETLLEETRSPFFLHTELIPDTEYVYHITAVDNSGNESDPSIISVLTGPDERVPSPPTEVQVFTNNGQLQVSFFTSTSNFVEKYNIDIYLIDVNNNIIDNLASVEVSDLDQESFVVDFDDLLIEDNARCQISIYAISNGGIDSEIVNLSFLSKYSPMYREVSNLDVSFSEELENPFTIFSIDMNWDYIPLNLSDGNVQPDGFYVQFIESGDRTVIGEEVYYRAGSLLSGTSYFLSTDLYPIIVEGQRENVVFKEYTSYFIIIRAVFGSFITQGYIYRIDKTPVYGDVPNVQNLSFARFEDYNYIVRWQNPGDTFFDYNILSLKYLDSVNYIIENLNIGKSDYYMILKEYFVPEKPYIVEIKSYNIFGQESSGISYTVFVQSIPEPSIVRDLFVESYDGVIQISWSEDISGSISYYQIYRYEGDEFIVPFDEFDLIVDEIPVNINSYIDYEVSASQQYSYFVVSVDILGRKSYDPESDGVYPDYKSVRFNPALPLITVDEITVEQIDNHSVRLSWVHPGGSFDGYQIFRSDANKYSFRLIGQSSFGETSFVDSNSLLFSNEVYYYFIKTFRDGGDYILLDKLLYNDESILLGEVYLDDYSGEITIDISNRRDLHNLYSPVNDILQQKIDNHKHSISGGIDRRINLIESEIIDDWETTNYINYTTNSNISNSGSYSLRISGTLNERYFKDSSGRIKSSELFYARMGFSPVSYSIKGNEVIFSKELYNSCILETNEESDRYINCKSPYLSPPVITLIFFDQSEVTNVLSNHQVQNVYASQIKSGIFDSSKLGAISHRGRIGELLQPLKIPLLDNGPYRYLIPDNYQRYVLEDSSDRLDFGTATTFFSIVEIEDNKLLASSSRGILYSDTFGTSWVDRVDLDEVIYKIFKTENFGILLFSNNNIFWSNQQSTDNWEMMSGLSAVSMIYSVSQDAVGNLYIGTDIGLYRFNVEKPYVQDVWEPLLPVDSASSQIYTVYCDLFNNLIYASTETGVFVSSDQALSWSNVDSIILFDKVKDFFIYQSCLFAVSDKYIYRKEMSSNDFEIVSILPGTIAYVFKSEIFNDKLYLLTDIGPCVSVPQVGIDIDDIFLMTETYGEIGYNGERPRAFCLDAINDKMFIGIEQKLYSVNVNDKVSLEYDDINAIIPTFYRNDVEMKFGYFYHNSGKMFIMEPTSPNEIIYVSNRYDIYFAKNKGWVSQNPDAKVNIYKNKQLLFEINDVNFDYSVFFDRQFPIISDRNSHYVKALEYETVLTERYSNIYLNSENIDNIFEYLSDTYLVYNEYLSYLYPSARFYVNDSDELIFFDFPSLSSSYENLLKHKVDVNVVNGRFKFSKQYHKYDVMEIDLFNVDLFNTGNYSHGEIEDKLEMVNSGLPENLSQVQQVNLLKLGLFSKKQLGWSEPESELKNQFILDSSEMIEQIDEENSTINNELLIDINPNEMAFFVLNDVLYYDNEFWIGGYESLIRINISDGAIRPVEINFNKNESVKKVKIINNNIYILTTYSIYRFEDNEIVAEDRTGLPNGLFNIDFFNGIYVVTATDGIYVRPENSIAWHRAVESEYPVKSIFTIGRVIAFVDDKFYISFDGLVFNVIDSISGWSDELRVYDIAKINNFLYFATNKGVYTDKGTMGTGSPVLDSISGTEGYFINSLFCSGATLYAAAEKSQYIKIVGSDVHIYSVNIMLSIDKIYKDINGIYLFGGNMILFPGLEYPIIIENGDLL